MHKAILFALCTFLLVLPSANAQSDNPLNPIGTAIGIVFGAGVIFFLFDNIFSLKINTPHIIESLILIFVAAIIGVSIFSAGITNNPEQPFYHPICGNTICDYYEKLSCSQDCTIINNSQIIVNLREFNRPIFSGVEIVMENESGSNNTCTLGALITINGTVRGLTAYHCFYGLGNTTTIYQGNSSIGTLYNYSDASDLALINLYPNATYNFQNYFGYIIGDCIMKDYPLENALVYKFGRTTGLTKGIITGIYTDDMNITASSGIFCDFGDSGSAIIINNRYNNAIVSILQTSNLNGTICTGVTPQNMLNSGLGFTECTFPLS